MRLAINVATTPPVRYARRARIPGTGASKSTSTIESSLGRGRAVAREPSLNTGLPGHERARVRPLAVSIPQLNRARARTLPAGSRGGALASADRLAAALTGASTPIGGTFRV